MRADRRADCHAVYDCVILATRNAGVIKRFSPRQPEPSAPAIIYIRHVAMSIILCRTAALL